MTAEQRHASLQRAGVTQEQIDETVGELPVHDASRQAHGVSRGDAESARTSIRQVLADVAIIAAKYSTAAKGDKGAAAVDPAEVERDRQHLDELFAEEYTLLTPFGEEQSKAQVVDAILSGAIQYDGMGRAGFEAVSRELRVHGDAATVIGDHRMRATGAAKHLQTGETFQQDLGGSYRITNNYVFRGGRWQASHSQMTKVPAEQTFTMAPGS
jgi:hypothetical protein